MLKLFALKKQSYFIARYGSIKIVQYLVADSDSLPAIFIQENIILEDIISLKARSHILPRKLCLLAIGAIPQRPPDSREIRCTYLAKYRRIRAHTHTCSRLIILISKNHHEMVRPYAYAYRRTEQYCGVAHCSTEDADIIRITIVQHFIDLTLARERVLTVSQARRFPKSLVYPRI